MEKITKWNKQLEKVAVIGNENFPLVQPEKHPEIQPELDTELQLEIQVEKQLEFGLCGRGLRDSTIF